METKLPPVFKKKWLEALRSGKYKQATGQLEKEGEYCCLGVACKIAGYSDNKMGDMGKLFKSHFPRIPQVLDDRNTVHLKSIDGFSVNASQQLVDLNDSGGKSFKQIADWIEKNL